MEKLPCILLVDDDPVNNFLNQRLLEDLAIADQLMVALNGQEAFALLEQHCPDAACPALTSAAWELSCCRGRRLRASLSEASLHSSD